MASSVVRRGILSARFQVSIVYRDVKITIPVIVNDVPYNPGMGSLAGFVEGMFRPDGRNTCLFCNI